MPELVEALITFLISMYLRGGDGGISGWLSLHRGGPDQPRSRGTSFRATNSEEADVVVNATTARQGFTILSAASVHAVTNHLSGQFA